MTKHFPAGRFGRGGLGLTLSLFFVALSLATIAGFASVWVPRAFSAPATNDEAALLDGYRHVEVA